VALHAGKPPAFEACALLSHRNVKHNVISTPFFFSRTFYASLIQMNRPQNLEIAR
jgi:hypothetical protein